MNVPEGFKQTEVGVIPQDWEVCQIGDFQPYVTSGSRGWAAYYAERGELFLRITNLTRNSIYLDLRDVKYVNLIGINSEAARTEIKDGDILISITADIGIIGYINNNIPKPAYINQHISLVRIDNSKVSPIFVSYFLSSERIQNDFLKLSDAGTKAGMNLSKVRQIKLALPPTKNEQTAIAAALSEMDALIEGVEKLLEKKRRIKQGAMQELLRPKEGWRKKKLGELFEINAGGDVEKEFFSNRTDEKYPYPIYSNSLSNYGLYGYSSHFTSDGNCITVTARGTIGYACFRDHRFAAIGRLLILRPKLDVDCFYISEFINNKIKFAFEVTGVPQLTAPQISKYDVWISDKKSEQTAIAAVLSDMDSEIEQLETQLVKYRQLKTGMMQELLTGKKRLV